jgi:TonB family protein
MKHKTFKTSILKSFLIFIVGVSFLHTANAQLVTNSQTDNILTEPLDSKLADKNQIYQVVEKMPQYPGGEKELMKFIVSNLKYPVIAQENGIQGRVIVRFVVSSTGKVSRIEVVRSLDPSCDKEAVRIIKMLPEWIPGEQNGQKVSVYYTLPITYKLTGGNTNPLDDANFRKTIVCVVDGVQQPIGFDFTSLVRENIAAINILKPDTEERKAALIVKYGEKASNGVLVIKTKQPIIIDSLKKDQAEERTYTVIEKMPIYPGGEAALLNFICRNLKYPLAAQVKGIQGKVILRFVVLKSGKVSNVEVLRSLYPACDNEAIRVIQMLEGWIPGEQKGEKVSVYYTLPITFKLQ